MRTARALLAALALAGLAACSDPGTGGCSGGASTPQAAPRQHLGLVGQQVRLLLIPFVPFGCDGEPTHLPDGLSVEVYAPDNRLVPHTARLDEPRMSAVVTFTPEGPGRYHVLAAFEPVGGLSQVGVLVAEDRTAESTPLPLPRECAVLERTARGTWVCDAQVVRDGVVTQELALTTPGAGVPLRVAVAGDVVWTADQGTLRRYVDTDEGLVLTASLSGGFSAPDFLLASEDELLMLHATFERYMYAEGTLSRTGSSTWADPLAGNVAMYEPDGVLVRAGDVVAVAARRMDPQTGVLGTQACMYQLSGGSYVRTQEACQQLPGTPVGFEDGVLWTQEAPQLSGPLGFTVRRHALVQGRFEEQGALLLGGGLQPFGLPLLRSSAVPVFAEVAVTGMTAVVVAWRPARQELVLEVLGRELTTPRASSSLYWGRTLDGTVTVRVRPLPP
jgi:hypothetical protein